MPRRISAWLFPISRSGLDTVPFHLRSFPGEPAGGPTAFRLDPTLVEAESCEGWVRAFGDWNWLGAERTSATHLRSIRNSAEAHRLYAWYLSAMCRHDEALWHATIASQLEPDSLAAAYAVGAACWWAHRFTEVTAVLKNWSRWIRRFLAPRGFTGACTTRRFVRGGHSAI